MNREKNRIDDLFRDGMEGHLKMPSPLVWDKIEAELDKKDRKHPFIFFLTSFKKPAGLLLLTIILGSFLTGGYFLIRSFSNINEKLPSDSIHENTKVNSDQHITPDTPSSEEIQENNNIEQSKKKESSENLATPKQPFLLVETEKKKETKKNNSSFTQPNQNTTHHIDADLNTKNVSLSKNTKQTENSKEQLNTKNPSNDAVANQPYVHESVPFKNKTDVAGSPAIIQSAGNLNHNASAVQVTEEQTKLALIAKVNGHQHELGPIVKSVVFFKPLPNFVKTPTTLAAPAANVSSVQTEASSTQNKKKKNIYFSVTPIFQYQEGKLKLVDIPPPPPPPGPPVVTISPFRLQATEYKNNPGLLVGLHFGKKLNIQTGLLYSTQYFHTDSLETNAVLRPDGNIKYCLFYDIGTVFLDHKFGIPPSVGDLLTMKDFTTQFTYLQIPLQVNYHFGKGKFQFFATAGGTYNKLSSLSISGVLQDVNAKYTVKDEEMSLKKHYIHASMGGGVKWNFYKNLSFTLSPQYHLALTPNYKITLLKTYPNNFTIQTGIQVGLHK